MAVHALKSPDDHDVSETVEETVEEHPWVEAVARVGWIAKGVVYVLMGLTAFTIGRRRPTPDDASPEGALAQVVSSPFGRGLLSVLAVGLLLYATWRVLSAALVRGNDAKDWLNRVGYVFSAAFYGVLAFTAFMAVAHDDSPDDSNTVERLSAWLLSSTIGRWTLLVAGAATLVVGMFFVVDKGLRQSFRKDLDFGDAPEAERRAVMAAGTVGWISRGVITGAVGWFVLRAAWLVDRSDARGFDRAIRELASTRIGSVAVLVTGLALVVYGVFCGLIVRHLELERVS